MAKWYKKSWLTVSWRGLWILTMRLWRSRSNLLLFSLRTLRNLARTCCSTEARGKGQLHSWKNSKTWSIVSIHAEFNFAYVSPALARTSGFELWPKRNFSRCWSAYFVKIPFRSVSFSKKPTTEPSWTFMNFSYSSMVDKSFEAGPTWDLMYLTIPTASLGPLYSWDSSPLRKIFRVG